jgi:hypothetical protein
MSALQATTTTGGHTALSEAAVQHLPASLRGTLLRPGDEEDTAFSHRETPYECYILASWANPEEVRPVSRPQEHLRPDEPLPGQPQHYADGRVGFSVIAHNDAHNIHSERCLRGVTETGICIGHGIMVRREAVPSQSVPNPVRSGTSRPHHGVRQQTRRSVHGYRER